jgi:predicted RNase H-like HicB family nuclease
MQKSKPSKRLAGVLKVEVTQEGKFSLTARLAGSLRKEGGVWISKCPPLDLITCGDTRNEAIANTKEAILQFFESCIQHRTLDKALKELKWIRQENINLDAITNPAKIMLDKATLNPNFKIKPNAKGEWTETIRIAA